MTLRFLYLLLICLTLSSSLARPLQVDTTQVDALIDEAFQLKRNALFEQSIVKFQEAKELAVSFNLTSRIYKAENQVVENYRRLRKLSEALERARTIFPLIQADLGSDHVEMGNINLQTGAIMMFMGELDTAKFYYEQAEAIFLENGKAGLEGLSAVYSNLGLLHNRLGDNDLFLAYMQKGLRITREAFGDEHIFVAVSLLNMGAQYVDRGLYNTAIQHLQESRTILEKIGIDGDLYSIVVANLGASFDSKGEFEKGYQYKTQALRNNIRLFGTPHINNVDMNYGLGSNFLRQELYDSSLLYLNRANVFKDQLREEQLKVFIYIQKDIALAYMGKGDYSSAYQYLSEAIDEAEKFSTTNEWLNFLYEELGLLQIETMEYEAAKVSLQKSLRAYERTHGEHPRLASPLSALARLDRLSGEYLKALEYVQRSIATNHENWSGTDLYSNPDGKGVEDRLAFIESLREKTQILRELYEKEKEPGQIEALADTYRVLDDALREIRQSFSSVKDKRLLLRSTKDVYEGAIRTHHQLYELTNDRLHLQKCFYYSEADKAVTLLDALGDLNASQWSKVPEEVLSLEEDTKSDIAYHLTRLKQEQGEDGDSTKAALLESQLFELNDRLDSIRNLVQDSFPAYHQLKYGLKPAAIEEVQETMEDGTLLIEYFVGNSMTYVSVVTNESLEFRSLGASEEIRGAAERFRRSLVVDLTENLGATDFSSSSRDLYKLVIAPIEDILAKYEAKDLIFVPADALNFVPFDLLLSADQGSGNQDYRSMPYLMTKYNMRNAFSASIDLLQDMKRKNLEGVVCFAPTYAENPTFQNAEGFGKFRNALVPLKWNTREVENIGALVSSVNFSGTEATESSFKSAVDNYKVIHLAMHTFVDDEDPMNSRLVFSLQDTTNDGFLHMFELYNMNLDAELAVLSACQTGYGKLVAGDGVMSLARGFAYAGVPSTIMSHWKVDDESTSKIMTYFYESLKEGKRKSEALRSAKLRFLNTTDPQHTHPFYWGAFIQIGNDEPVFQTNRYSTYIFLVAGIIFLFLIGKRLSSPRSTKSS